MDAGTCVTVTVIDEEAWPTVAVICVLPPPADVTTPAALTLATAVLPVDHVSCALGNGSPC